jgi:ATP phosphoribosyltransferase
VEVETIAEITTRLVVNRASLKTKHQRIRGIIDGLEQVLLTRSNERAVS